MSLLTYIIFAVLGVVTRIPFNLVGNRSTSDNAGVRAKLLALRKHGFNYKIPNALNANGFFPRPILLHYLVSKLPKRMWRISMVLLNCSFDVLAALTTVLVVRNFYPDLSTLSVLLLFGISISSPVLFPATARLKATNNRTFGLFLSQVYFSLFLFFNDSPWLVAGMALVALLVVLSSTFAMQLLFFVSAIAGIFMMDVKLFLPVVVMLAVVFATNILGSRDLILFKWIHLKFTHVTRDDSFSVMNKALFFNRSMFQKGTDPIVNAINLILHQSGFLKLLWGLPVLWFCVWFYFANVPLTFLGSFPDFLSLKISLLTTAVLFVFVVTSFGIGRLVGESERYLEILSFIVPILLASFMSINAISEQTLLLILLVHILVIIVISILNINSATQILAGFKSTFSPQIHELVENLKTHAKANVATVPIRLSRALTTCLDEDADKFHFYYRLVCEKPILKKGIDTFLSESFKTNFLTITPIELSKTYGVNIVIIENSSYQKLEKKFRFDLENNCQKTFANDQFSLFEIRESA